MEDKHIRYYLGDLESVAIHYQGSGNPGDTHKIIGVEFWDGTVKHEIGDCGQKTGVDVNEKAPWAKEK